MRSWRITIHHSGARPRQVVIDQRSEDSTERKAIIAPFDSNTLEVHCEKQIRSPPETGGAVQT